MQKGRENHNFALQIWFTAYSLGYTQGSKKWTTRVKKFLKRLELALALEEELGSALDLLATSIQGVAESPFCNGLDALPPPLLTSSSSTSQSELPALAAPVPASDASSPRDAELDKKSVDVDDRSRVFPSRSARRAGKAYFFGQVECMRELVDISAKLALKFSQPDTFKPEMRRLLESIGVRYVAEGTAYLPHTMEARHRILRINLDDCFPIPTYGRVLYFLMVEVVPIPTNCSTEMAEDILRAANEAHKSCALSFAF